MGNAHQDGGIYKDAQGDGYHDAHGKPVESKVARAAVKKAEKEGPPTAPATGETTTPASAEKKGSLPADFPHRELLEAQGITSYGKLRDADLAAVEGIGPARQSEIEEALKA